MAELSGRICLIICEEEEKGRMKIVANSATYSQNGKQKKRKCDR